MEPNKSGYICKLCRNLLTDKMSQMNFQLDCSKCNVTNEITDEDTLIYEDKTDSIVSSYHSNLENVLYDPVAIRLCNQKCNVCKENVSIRATRVGDKLDLIKICEQHGRSIDREE